MSLFANRLVRCFPMGRGYLALVLLSTISSLQAGTPRVSACYPSGGQRGTEVDVAFSASNIKDARAILFDEPGIEATAVDGTGPKLKAKFKIAADATLGEHRFRVITNSGIADLRVFLVTPFPLIEEVEDKADPKKTQVVPLNVTVYGRTQGEDQDYYEVEAQKGQRITAEVVGARLQSQSVYDSAVSIAKKDGTELAQSDDTAFGRQDPVASTVVPEDGKYVITIRDSTNQGNGECHYLMHIGTYAQPLSVYPPGGAIGEDLKVTLLGDASGPLAQSVKLPDKPDDHFPVFASVDQPAPMPNFIRVSNFPNVLENEPNEDFTHATSGPETLPLAFNGVIEKKGDVDFFKFIAKKGQAYDLTVYARQLRSPLDSVLAIYNSKGGQIQSNDDEGEPDSHLRWSAPEDGVFFLSIADQLNRGGSIFTYRVEVVPVEPKIATYLPEVVQNSNQERRAVPVPKGNRYATMVKIKRSDWGGDLKLEPTNLPGGMTFTGGGVDKTADTIAMVFEASPDAPSEQKMVSLEVKIPEAPKDATPVKNAVEQVVNIVENGNQKPFYTVAENAFAAAVVDKIPVKISLAQPKVPVLVNGSMNLRIHAERTDDFKGPVTLSLLYAPAGVGSPGTATMKEGENEATLAISANDKAPLHTWQVCVVGSADFGSGPVFFSTELVNLEVGAAFLVGSIQRTFVDQGDSTSVTVKLDPKADFEGKAKISLQGLPSGVTAEDQEVGKDDKEVKFTVKADAKATAGQHKQLFCQFKLVRDGEEMLSTFAMGGVLRVDKAAVAKIADTK